MDIIRAALKHGQRRAVTTVEGTYSYLAILQHALELAQALSRHPAWPARGPSTGPSGTPTGPLAGPRVALYVPPGPAYVAGTLAAWLAGGVAVPLSASHPDKELQYFMQDSGCSALLTADGSAQHMASLIDKRATALHVIPPPESMQIQHPGDANNSSVVSSHLVEAVQQSMHQMPADGSAGCLIVYTSGTTSRPKGVLHTHRSVLSQTQTLVDAWQWQQSDRILHTLPLHHVHGIVNALYCPLLVGATVEMLPKFSATSVWQALMRQTDSVSVFMGVPTMYSYLLEAYQKMDPDAQQQAKHAAGRLRLTVSGSAACPIAIMQAWKELSGTMLLERYGMTEIGMALSNPYKGERRPGFVGLPLPGVQVRCDPSQGPGELLVRGPSVFAEYWNRPEATAESFTADGYFRTGDVVEQTGDPPYWRVLGRASVDIIKSGGYKLSALDIENAIAQHPDVRECAVVGMPHDHLGEEVVAVVATREGSAALSVETLVEWLKDRLPCYSMPKKCVLLPQLPRNAMGKLNKKELKQQLMG